MENIFRIVFLMFFLSGSEGHPAYDKDLKKFEMGIKHLRNTITCPEGSVFYAPSPADVEKSVAAALACSIQQLKYLTNSTNLQYHINKTIKVLQGMIVDKNSTDSSECIRENPLFKMSFKDFMENINTLTASLAVKLFQ